MTFQPAWPFLLIALSAFISRPCAVEAQTATTPRQSTIRADWDIVRELEVASVFSMTNVTFNAVTRGRTFELYLKTSRDAEYGPLILWKPRNEEPHLIDSLAAVNVVLADVWASEKSPSTSTLADVVHGLLVRQRLAQGNPPSGFAVVGSLRATFLKALKTRLPADRAAQLESHLEPAKFAVDGASWRSTWVEIDREGGVEKVSIEGSSSPWRVQRVIREAVLDAGSIPVGLLDPLLITGGRDERPVQAK